MALGLLVAANVLTASAGLSQMLDRVAASVGNTAITEYDVGLEYRFERFLEGRSPTGEADPETRKAVLNRLISQTLLLEELQNSPRDVPAKLQDAGEVLQEVRKRFPSPAEYQSAIHRLGMTEAQIVQRIEAYKQTLRLIDERFRPVASPSPEEVEHYYGTTFKTEYRHLHAGAAPSLKDVEPQIREILVQHKIDQLLNEWLGEMRTVQHVKIHTF